MKQMAKTKEKILKRRVLLVGNNVDKRELFETMDKISKDWDIKRLIFQGRFIIYLRLVLFILLLGHSISALVTSDFFLNINELSIRVSLNLLLATLTILGALALLYELVSSIKDIREQSMELRKYFRYTISKSVPRTPLDMWRFIQGSVADIQMYNTIRNLSEVDDAENQIQYEVCYTGMPYYTTHCLDSIYVKWNTETLKGIKRKQKLGTRMSLWRFFNQYCQDTILAMAEKSYFKENNKHVEYSNSVFGILFSSMYFQKEIEQANIKLAKKLKVNIVIGGYPEEDTLLKEKLALEWMKMVLAPEYFEIEVNGKGKADIEVLDITCFEDKNKLEFWDRIKKDWRLRRLPIKRYIVLPVDGEEIPRSISKKNEEEIEIICIGGAEQNMALQHTVNCYRWSEPEGKRKVGFAENIWDGAFCDDFLMGTEGLVYGVRDNVIGRMMDDKGISCKAEVYKLDFPVNKFSFYGVYGYSAMASKIALCELIYCLDKKCEMVFNQMIPGFHEEKKKVLDYVLASEKETPIYKTSTGDQWDTEDLMNHVEKLRVWLGSSKNQIEIL